MCSVDSILQNNCLGNESFLLPERRPETPGPPASLSQPHITEVISVLDVSPFIIASDWGEGGVPHLKPWLSKPSAWPQSTGRP